MQTYANFSVGDVSRSEEDDNQTRVDISKTVTMEAVEFNEAELRAAFEDFVRVVKRNYF